MLIGLRLRSLNTGGCGTLLPRSRKPGSPKVTGQARGLLSFEDDLNEEEEGEVRMQRARKSEASDFVSSVGLLTVQHNPNLATCCHMTLT